MAPPAPERVMKIDARGSQKEPHRSNFAPPGVLWSPPGRLGRQVGLRRALWAEKRRLEIERRALGTILGSSWRVLGPFWVAFPPPLGGPGEAPGGHFWTFLGRPSQDPKIELLFVVFSHSWGLFFCAIICPLLSSLLRGWRRRAYAKN